MHYFSSVNFEHGITILLYISMTNNVIHVAYLRNFEKTIFTNSIAFFILYGRNIYK